RRYPVARPALAEELQVEELAERQPGRRPRIRVRLRLAHPGELRGEVGRVQHAAGASVHGTLVELGAKPRGRDPRPRVGPGDEASRRPTARVDPQEAVPERGAGDDGDLPGSPSRPEEHLV